MSSLINQLDHITADPIPRRRLVAGYAVGMVLGVGIALTALLAAAG